MTFPSTLDTDFGTVVDNVDDVLAAHINTLRRAVEGLEAKVGIDSSAVTTTLDYKVNSFFVTGRKVYLYEDTAPTGWSIVSVTDKVLAVKGGTGSYNITGGNTGGSFTITEAQMPAHTHNMTFWRAASNGGTNPAGYLYVTTSFVAATASAGSGASTYRPAACVGVIVQKS